MTKGFKTMADFCDETREFSVIERVDKDDYDCGAKRISFDKCLADLRALAAERGFRLVMKMPHIRRLPEEFIVSGYYWPHYGWLCVWKITVKAVKVA
jgi:hypothetical protein